MVTEVPPAEKDGEKRVSSTELQPLRFFSSDERGEWTEDKNGYERKSTFQVVLVVPSWKVPKFLRVGLFGSPPLMTVR